MKDLLFLKFQEKITPFVKANSKFLLALSGGPDSMVLFHLLQKAKIAFTALYIDHGWRMESQKEGKSLAKMCQEVGIPFEVRVIENFDYEKGNIEDRLRIERQQIFKECAKAIGADTILLGHHLDDQAETVIKRLFEGAKLTRLGAISEESVWCRQLRILRPLMGVTKWEILEWAKRYDIDYFVDKTNEDTRFLRARMRKEMVPALEKSFGKGIGRNLCALASYSSKLASYLDQRTDCIFNAIDFSQKSLRVPVLDEEVEMTHLIDRILRKLKAVLSRDQVMTLFKLSQKKVSGKKVETAHICCTYERGALVFEIQQTPL